MWGRKGLPQSPLSITFCKRLSCRLFILCIKSSPRSLLRMKSLTRSCLRRESRRVTGPHNRASSEGIRGSPGGGSRPAGARGRRGAPVPPAAAPPRPSGRRAPRAGSQPWLRSAARRRRRHGDRLARHWPAAAGAERSPPMGGGERRRGGGLCPRAERGRERRAAGVRSAAWARSGLVQPGGAAAELPRTRTAPLALRPSHRAPCLLQPCAERSGAGQRSPSSLLPEGTLTPYQEPL